MPRLFPEDVKPPRVGKVTSSQQPAVSPVQVVDPQRPQDRLHPIEGNGRRAVRNRANTTE